MPAILWRPSCRSRKKINSSGCFCEIEFAANRFFNLFPLASVVLGEFVRGFTGLEALGDDICAHARASDDAFPKRYARIAYDGLCLFSFISSRERIRTARVS